MFFLVQNHTKPHYGILKPTSWKWGETVETRWEFPWTEFGVLLPSHPPKYQTFQQYIPCNIRWILRFPFPFIFPPYVYIYYILYYSSKLSKFYFSIPSFHIFFPSTKVSPHAPPFSRFRGPKRAPSVSSIRCCSTAPGWNAPRTCATSSRAYALGRRPRRCCVHGHGWNGWMDGWLIDMVPPMRNQPIGRLSNRYW